MILAPKSRVIAFLGMFVIVVIIGILAFQGLKSIEMPTSQLFLIMPTLEDKKIVFIVAFRDFRDEEYFLPKEVLEAAGTEIKTASTQKGQAIGVDGGETEVDLLLSEINPVDFNAVVFIGGPGCLEYLDNENSYKVARETISQNKILAAICISPVILAKAGVLEGKKATVWSNLLDRSPIKILEYYKAVYQDELVVIDGKIVTGSGPIAAKKFGEAIIEVLTKE